MIRRLVVALLFLFGLGGSAFATTTYYQPTASTAVMQAYGQSSPFVAHAFVYGALGGAFDWQASSCSPDNVTWFAANGVSSGAGCWHRSIPGYFNVRNNFFPIGGGIVSNHQVGATDCNGRAEALGCFYGLGLGGLVSVGDGTSPALTSTEAAWETRNIDFAGDWVESSSISVRHYNLSNSLTDYNVMRLSVNGGNSVIPDSNSIEECLYAIHGVDFFNSPCDSTVASPGNGVIRVFGSLNINANSDHTQGNADSNRNVNFISNISDFIVRQVRGSNTNQALWELGTGASGSVTANWLIGLRSTSDSNLHFYSNSLAADALVINYATGIMTAASPNFTGTLTGVNGTFSGILKGQQEVRAGDDGADAMIRLGTISAAEAYAAAIRTDVATAAQFDFFTGSTKAMFLDNTALLNIGTAMDIANSTATVAGTASLGPTGTGCVIASWLKVKDHSANVRYIPLFNCS